MQEQGQGSKPERILLNQVAPLWGPGRGDMIHIEVIYQGDHCPSCYYMAEAVEQILPKFVGLVKFTKVEFMKSRAHAKRFYELSVSLYGEEQIKNRLRCAPIPSLFINGILAFDMIPPMNELEAAIQNAIMQSFEKGGFKDAT